MLPILARQPCQVMMTCIGMLCNIAAAGSCGPGAGPGSHSYRGMQAVAPGQLHVQWQPENHRKRRRHSGAAIGMSSNVIADAAIITAPGE